MRLIMSDELWCMAYDSYEAMRIHRKLDKGRSCGLLSDSVTIGRHY